MAIEEACTFNAIELDQIARHMLHGQHADSARIGHGLQRCPSLWHIGYKLHIAGMLGTSIGPLDPKWEAKAFGQLRRNRLTHMQRHIGRLGYLYCVKHFSQMLTSSAQQGQRLIDHTEPP